MFIKNSSNELNHLKLLHSVQNITTSTMIFIYLPKLLLSIKFVLDPYLQMLLPAACRVS